MPESKVYLIRVAADESTESISAKLSKLIKKSGVLSSIRRDDFTAVKLHFGDRGNTGHIKPEWIAEAVKHVKMITPNVFLADTNVIYKASSRTNSIDHLKLADQHGFDLKNTLAPIIIADGLRGRNFVEVPVNGKHFSKIKMASDFADCDSMLAMTHVTGHILTGMGAAIKNIGMGCSSRRGKYEMHCGAVPEVDDNYCLGCGQCVQICPGGALSLNNKKISIAENDCIGCGECAVVCKTKAIEIRWSETLENLQEKMVEYSKGAIDALSARIGYINFIIKVTKDCDCLAKDDPRIVDDIGILASHDPVAIDKASADLVIAAGGKDLFGSGYPETDWSMHLKYASKIGIGSLEYKLEEIF